MKLEITIQEKNKISATMTSKSGLAQSFDNLTALSAIKELQVMIEEDRLDNLNIKDTIDDMLAEVEIGDTIKFDTLDKSFDNFRVRLHYYYKETGIKFKTKIVNGALLGTRVK